MRPETNPTPAALVRELTPYVEARRRGAFATDFDAAEVALTRELSRVERATLRVVLKPLTGAASLDLREEARLRLAIFDARGLLNRMSGEEIADNLTRIYSTSLRTRPFKGYWLLWQLDAHDLAEVTIGTVDPTNSLAYCRVRLSDRMAGLEAEKLRTLALA
jgi:hypothetical protein